MALSEGQASVAGLVLGRGTQYKLVGFNPWARSNRHDQQDRAWAHGSWSGAEWADAVTVPVRLRILGTSAAEWLALHRALRKAFRATGTDIELRYCLGGTEYVMYGRPRVVEPEAHMIGTGQVFTAAAFVALDPREYSAVPTSVPLTLPSVSGGLTAPVTVPFSIGATVTSGRLTITQTGDSPAAMQLRIDAGGALLTEPRVSLRYTDPQLGPVTQTLRCGLTLAAGQWLDVDTGAHTAYLNGTSSRRGLVSGDWPLLPAVPAELAFDAAAYSAVASLTATWRDTWL